MTEEATKTLTIRVDESDFTAIAPNIVTGLICLGGVHGRVDLFVGGPPITPRSQVFMSYGEWDPNRQKKFLGAATMRVENIAPDQDGVHVRLFVDWPTNLNTCLDVLIANNP